ncbi:uncharacterized protein ACIGJ3_001761 [Trichechus inunguis]
MSRLDGGNAVRDISQRTLSLSAFPSLTGRASAAGRERAAWPQPREPAGLELRGGRSAPEKGREPSREPPAGWGDNAAPSSTRPALPPPCRALRHRRSGWRTAPSARRLILGPRSRGRGDTQAAGHGKGCVPRRPPERGRASRGRRRVGAPRGPRRQPRERGGGAAEAKRSVPASPFQEGRAEPGKAISCPEAVLPTGGGWGALTLCINGGRHGVAVRCLSSSAAAGGSLPLDWAALLGFTVPARLAGAGLSSGNRAGRRRVPRPRGKEADEAHALLPGWEWPERARSLTGELRPLLPPKSHQTAATLLAEGSDTPRKGPRGRGGSGLRAGEPREWQRRRAGGRAPAWLLRLGWSSATLRGVRPRSLALQGEWAPCSQRSKVRVLAQHRGWGGQSGPGTPELRPLQIVRGSAQDRKGPLSRPGFVKARGPACQRPFLTPEVQASAVTICALPASPPDPERGPSGERVRSAPRGPRSTSRADLWGKPGSDRRRPAETSAQKPRAWDPIQRLSADRQTDNKNPQAQGPRDAPGPCCPLSAGRLASAARSPCSRVPRPLPEGRRAQLRKGQKERNPRHGDALGRSPCPRPRRPCPHSHLRQLGEGRDAATARGSCPPLPEQSPPRELAAAQGAGDKGDRAAGCAELPVCTPTTGWEEGPGRWGCA